MESPPGSARFSARPNPVGIEALTALIEDFPHRTVAVTGGEPLEQVDFLAAWLPRIAQVYRILLETDGIRHQAIARVAPFVHIVSMDIKLPSSTGMRAYWKEHAAFLAAARQGPAEVYCKMVITDTTSAEEVMRAARWLRETAPVCSLVLQPASPTERFAGTPTAEQLAGHAEACRALLRDVRVIPQMHKQWGML